MTRAVRLIREFVVLSHIFEISIMSFIVITAIGIFDMIIPLYVEGFAEKVALIGLIVAMPYIASIIAEIPTGIMVDKYGRKRVLLIALFVFGLVGILYYLFANSIAILALLGMLFGVTSVAFWIGSAVLVRDYSPKEMLGESEGVYLSISSIGWIIGPMIGGIIAFYFSDQFNFLIIAALLFASFAYSFIVLVEAKIKKKRTYMRIKALKLFREFYEMHEHALPLYLLSLFLNVWIGVEWTYTQLSLQNVFGINELIIGGVLAGMMLSETLLYFPAGYIMDKIGKRYIILAGFLLLFGASYYAFLSQTAALFVFMLFLAAGAIGWVFPGTEALLTEITPAHKRGEMTGIFDTSKDIGLVVGMLFGGVLADTTFNLMTPFLLVTVVAVLGVIFGLKLWTGAIK
ncbi:TPA: MFS transporter [archaeon]|uniref:MFS transporter n=1 Tax=Candidatus Naiadarchaeum limnaeum TaxID=2756139 RepID=A0A832V348_9ARCH|nr:MFS transporter [Candidatus Naiadarchaeales archaeon SRR2090153.bin1042]HIK00132.1 MFS transporter [Candidatus Naiadarchaeum limnaeum]